MNAVRKFNEYIYSGWTPVAIPGELNSEEVLYVAGFPSRYLYNFDEKYKSADKTMIALMILAHEMAKKRGIKPNG